MRFDDYGELEFLEPEDFYKGGWSVCGQVIGEDGIWYDIVINSDRTEVRFACV